MDQKRYKEKRKERQCSLCYTKAGVVLVILFLVSGLGFSQELFPTMEPASTMPKKVIGFRQVNEVYRDINLRFKYYGGFRLMYGLTKKMTVMSMLGLSNHHFKRIPGGLNNYIRNHHSAGFRIPPFLIEGLHTYVKYRVWTQDGEQKHFRIAVYGEFNKSFVAHTEGEPNLMTDNSGYGGGLLITQLYKRFAVSFTPGFIKSFAYLQEDPNMEIKFRSGDVLMYNLAFGYRLYPKVYNGYKDINVNLYAEFINRNYTAAEIYYNGDVYDYDFLRTAVGYSYNYTYNSLKANKYSELRSTVQFIFNSNSRLDLGIALPVYSRSYLYDYPLVYLNIQKYLFR
jgi:hypothetical protein